MFETTNQVVFSYILYDRTTDSLCHRTDSQFYNGTDSQSYNRTDSQCNRTNLCGGLHKWGYPNSWMVYFMENPTLKWMIWEFGGTPMLGNPQRSHTVNHLLKNGIN